MTYKGEHMGRMTHYYGDDCGGGHLSDLTDDELKIAYATKESALWYLNKLADELQRRGYRVSAGRIMRDPKRRKNI